MVPIDLKMSATEDRDHPIPVDRWELEKRLKRHACMKFQEKNSTTASQLTLQKRLSREAKCLQRELPRLLQTVVIL